MPWDSELRRPATRSIRSGSRLKAALRRFVLSPAFQTSHLGEPFRRFVRANRDACSARFLLDSQAAEWTGYAYGLISAADLANRLGIKRISAIEFGVAGGRGLAFLVDFAKRVERQTGVIIDCYGFDTGQGMPDPEGVKDLPYWFRAQQYPMDEPALRAKVPDAQLVIGNIRDTIQSFVEKYKPAPIGAILHDVDYHSSTRDSLRLFEYVESFLPRVFMYFDDIIGGASEMYGPFNGQLAAIEEFNRTHDGVKIHLNQNLLPESHLHYRYKVYYGHLFDHPLYDRYIGGGHQLGLEGELRLR